MDNGFSSKEAIERVRVTRPGAIETALNGWMTSGSDHALRRTWPYSSKCNAPPLSGFPSTPCNYPLDGGRRTRWSELRPTLISEGQGLGSITVSDPVAVGDTEYVSRLYITESYSLLLTARWNGVVPADQILCLLQQAALKHALQAPFLGGLK